VELSIILIGNKKGEASTLNNIGAVQENLLFIDI
jgi:hypothetical protein